MRLTNTHPSAPSITSPTSTDLAEKQRTGGNSIPISSVAPSHFPPPALPHGPAAASHPQAPPGALTTNPKSHLILQQHPPCGNWGPIYSNPNPPSGMSPWTSSMVTSCPGLGPRGQHASPTTMGVVHNTTMTPLLCSPGHPDMAIPSVPQNTTPLLSRRCLPLSLEGPSLKRRSQQEKCQTPAEASDGRAAVGTQASRRLALIEAL